MPQLNAIGIVASDLARSIRFYRLLGLDVPETPDEGHIDTFLPNGVRFMLDTEETVRSFRARLVARDGEPARARVRVRESRRSGRGLRARDGAGFQGEREPFDAFWGQRYASVLDPDGVPVDLYAAN